MNAESLIDQYLEGKVPDAFKKFIIKKGENKPSKKDSKDDKE